MADNVLSILTSKLCAATALCSKLLLRFHNNEEHKNSLSFTKFWVNSNINRIEAKTLLDAILGKFNCFIYSTRYCSGIKKIARFEKAKCEKQLYYQLRSTV